MTVSVPLVRGSEARDRSAGTDTVPAPSDRAVLWLVGMLMATTPATAREVEHILSAAAARAGLPEAVLAAAVLDASRGLPVLACADGRFARPSAARVEGGARKRTRRKPGAPPPAQTDEGKREPVE
ncbi:hypothetical protein [Streptomyces sp. NPDC056527]|uniref:hypothetical protein n=1 Tax=Streptomyces sp. NPDC056527 TaxID=3345853 RepID=UPI0036A28846